MRFTSKATSTLLSGLVAAGAGVTALGVTVPAAFAATTPTNATTHVVNRPDSGHGGTWAYDTFNRALSIAVAPSQAGVPAGEVLYTATITDNGTFSTVGGALAPNQSTAGVKVTRNGVKGVMSGHYQFNVTAPEGDSLTGVVPALEDDAFGTPKVATDDWPKQAFATATGVTVTGGSYSWQYKTGCETWTDSSTNGDGNEAGDGNITGALCPVPYVYGGHVETVSQSKATVGWSDSEKGWPTRADGRKCVVVLEQGYGFAGNGHWGFTCDTTGYLWGLTKGHTYALTVVPAAADASYTNRVPLMGANLKAHVTVVTAS